MEETRNIIKTIAGILGIIYTIKFIFTGKASDGIWVLIMGEIAYH